MADVFTKKKRSEIMAAVRSTGNKLTETSLSAMFHRSGIKGWRQFGLFLKCVSQSGSELL
jgi:G:T-mismatch repair DNA endonuclease (very short patch repair protein)